MTRGLKGVPPVQDLLRLGLLASALLAGFGPVYQFVGSMIVFHRYRGDYQVFWAITKVPLEQIYDYRVFAYPPTTMLLLIPFGLLPFWPALVAWTAAGAAVLSSTAKRIMRPAALALGFLTYAGIGVLFGGQISLFVGACIMGAFATSNPPLRGILLAIAAMMKPHSALAAPFALLAERNWRAIAWAVGTGGGLLLLSFAFFGADLWQRWFDELPKFYAYLVGRGLDRTDVGIYGLVRRLGLPGWTFAFGAPLGISTCWLTFRREVAALDRYIAFATATVLLSPYTLYYDLAGLTFACIALLLDRERSPVVWLAAAMIVSSILASLGIILLAGKLSFDALRQRTARADTPATQLSHSKRKLEGA